MRFLSIYKTAETGVPPTPEHMETMQRLIEEGMKAGWLLATEGCLPTALGARVRSSGGNVIVTDGPFAETKEVVAGFALLEAASKEEAIRMTRDFLKIAGDGECELRQIFTPTDGAGDCPGVHRELTGQFAGQ
ncbi:MAG TPA: YciI family protein [Vicinamibacterales bacterium]|nr:YciI family protein [Vicinamibacterales bacterium]